MPFPFENNPFGLQYSRRASVTVASASPIVECQLEGKALHRQQILVALRSRRTFVTGTLIALCVAAVFVGISLSGSKSAAPPIVYTNVSRNFKTCLLTTTTDSASTAAVWPAVQAAARNKPINAQHVVAPGGPTTELVPYVNSLLALHCSLAITAGADLTDAVVTVAEAHPDERFVNVSSRGAELGNVQDVPDDGSSGIARLVVTACRC